MQANENGSASSIDNTSGRTLASRHRDELRRSGLTDETIALSGNYTEVSKAAVHEILHWPETMHADGTAHVFPYPGCDGYAAVKLDAPRTTGGIDPKIGRAYSDACGHAPERQEQWAEMQADAAGETIKYEKPLGVPPRLYMPTQIRPEIRDQSKPLWVGEGEKKALAACQSKLAFVSVGGVTCFGDAQFRRWAKGEGRNLKRLHPDLVALIQAGRVVVLCFDSDVDTNLNVTRALAEAAKLLIEHGAEVRVAYVPAVKGIEKTGLDDYLASLPDEERLGPRPLKEIEDSVRPVNAYEVLDWLDEQRFEDWSKKQRDLELGRAARLARFIFTSDSDMQQWIKEAARLLHMTQKEVKRLVPNVQREKRASLTLREWLKQWMANNIVTFDYATDGLIIAGKKVPLDNAANKLVLDANEQGVGFGERLLDRALQEWLFRERELVVERHRVRLGFRPDVGDREIRRWVRAVTGDERPLDVAVMKHFVWQVKRKLHGLPVDHHLMVVLHGVTGGGKTEAVKRLLSALADLVDHLGDLSLLNDERQAFRLATYYVVFIDEMAKADRVCIENLRRVVTAAIVNWRVLGKNKRTSAPNVATFIGCTNPDIRDVIYDPLSMRRFFQMECLDLLDWNVINSIDYAELWSSIDETAKSPILPLFDELRIAQEELRAKDALEEHLDREWIIGDGVFTRARDFLLHFADDQKRMGKQVWTDSRVGRRLKDILKARVGGDGIGWKESNGVHYQIRKRHTSADRIDKLLSEAPLPHKTPRAAA